LVTRYPIHFGDEDEGLGGGDKVADNNGHGHDGGCIFLLVQNRAQADLH
jgi:hypothetical protein